jgi:DNA-binding NarL/FixJ family response regulator
LHAGSFALQRPRSNGAGRRIKVRFARLEVRVAVWEIRLPSTTIAVMKRKILIVDDHASFRASARRLLEAGGYSVVAEAADGSSGVSAAAESRPDLALVDVQLPDFDGFEVTRRLRESDESLEIVLISSLERSDFGSLVDTSGARGFVSKGDLSTEALEALLQ